MTVRKYIVSDVARRIQGAPMHDRMPSIEQFLGHAARVSPGTLYRALGLEGDWRCTAIASPVVLLAYEPGAVPQSSWTMLDWLDTVRTAIVLGDLSLGAVRLTHPRLPNVRFALVRTNAVPGGTLASGWWELHLWENTEAPGPTVVTSGGWRAPLADALCREGKAIRESYEQASGKAPSAVDLHRPSGASSGPARLSDQSVRMLAMASALEWAATLPPGGGPLANGGPHYLMDCATLRTATALESTPLSLEAAPVFLQWWLASAASILAERAARVQPA